MSKYLITSLFHTKFILTIVVLISMMAVPSMAQVALHWKVVSSGGTNASSGALNLRGTIGQTAATYSTAAAIELNAGFWQNFGFVGCCIGIKGDINGDGIDNKILDLTYLINDMFRGGPSSPCPKESDLNNDGTPANIFDLIFMIDDIYRGGPTSSSCL